MTTVCSTLEFLGRFWWGAGAVAPRLVWLALRPLGAPVGIAAVVIRFTPAPRRALWRFRKTAWRDEETAWRNYLADRLALVAEALTAENRGPRPFECEKWTSISSPKTRRRFRDRDAADYGHRPRGVADIGRAAWCDTLHKATVPALAGVRPLDSAVWPCGREPRRVIRARHANARGANPMRHSRSWWNRRFASNRRNAF